MSRREVCGGEGDVSGGLSSHRSSRGLSNMRERIQGGGVGEDAAERDSQQQPKWLQRASEREGGSYTHEEVGGC